MRILILSQNYYPEPVNVWSELSESIRGKGHDVTVLTGFPNWPSGKLYPGYRIKLWQKEIIGGVTVIRVPLYPYHGRSAFKRAFNYLSFMLASCVLGIFLVGDRPDIILAIQPPTTCLPAWLFSRIWRIPFTYDLEDMWPETLHATGMISNTRMLQILAKCCSWTYKHAAGIRVISPGFRTNLIEKGVDKDKIYFIPNWVNTEFYKPQEPDAALAQRFGLTNHINIFYAGTIGLAQGLDTVLEAASLLKDLRKVQFVLAGDGVDLERLKKLTISLQINNVRFLGRQPVNQMPAFYALSDMLLVHLRNDPLFRITIPHKILTYLASGKPVLAAAEGDAADVVRAAGAGLICRPGDPEALAASIRKYCDMTADHRAIMGRNGRKVACDYYAKDYLIEQICQMLSDVVSLSRSSKLMSY